MERFSVWEYRIITASKSAVDVATLYDSEPYVVALAYARTILEPFG